MIVLLLDLVLLLLFVVLLMNFGGYSLLLQILAKFKTIEHTIDPDFTPPVTLLISCYNEEAVLEEKIENSLALEYPTGLLNIVVVSDGSTDGTNEIAARYKNHGIDLFALEINKGKASALNEALENIDSEIVVLSDANVMYQSDVIKKLVRHFADPSIGAVTGKVTLRNDGLSYSDAEDMYYDVEHKIQQMESSTGNLIGADGAMYALRRELVRPLAADTLVDDFVMSMGVIQQNKRLIFDGSALGFEENLAEMGSEYNRKVRIIAGGMQCLKRGTVWPPKGDTLTAVKFSCHKIMRWIIGPVAVLFLLVLLIRGIASGHSLIIGLSSLLIVGLVASVALLKIFPQLSKHKIVSTYTYLLVMLKASIVGCYKGLVGQRVNWR